MGFSECKCYFIEGGFEEVKSCWTARQHALQFELTEHKIKVKSKDSSSGEWVASCELRQSCSDPFYISISRAMWCGPGNQWLNNVPLWLRGWCSQLGFWLIKEKEKESWSGFIVTLCWVPWKRRKLCKDFFYVSVKKSFNSYCLFISRWIKSRLRLILSYNDTAQIQPYIFQSRG